MRILAVLIHADPSMRRRYEEAAGADVEVLPVLRPGLSSVYAHLAAECRARGAGSAVRGLLQTHGRSVADYDAILLCPFSAGYAFARGIPDSDRRLLAGLVSIDSAHAALDPDGTAADAGAFGVEWLVTWARDAIAGQKVLVIGHSDVEPGSYASTTKVAKEVIRLAGAPSGHFLVRAFDLKPPAEAKAEHGAALTDWGPGLVAEAVGRVRAILLARSPEGEPVAPPSEDTVDEPAPDAADIARSYVAAGLKEVPGPQHDATIQRMLAACRRGGSPRAGMGSDRTGSGVFGPSVPDEVEWCCAMASTCEAESGADEQTAVFGRRCACWEAVADSRQLGTFHDVAEEDFLPERGDYVVLGRGEGDPRVPGQPGHIGLVEERVGDELRCIDGNSANRARPVTRLRSDPAIVGYIRGRRRLPSQTIPAAPPSDVGLAVVVDRLAREAISLDLDQGPSEA